MPRGATRRKLLYFTGGVVNSDNATERLSLRPSAVETDQRVDSGSLRLKLTVSSTDVQQGATVDAATERIKLTPSAVEQQTHVRVDSGTGKLSLTPSAFEGTTASAFIHNRKAITTGLATITFHPDGDCAVGNTLLMLITTLPKMDVLSVTDTQGNPVTIEIPSQGASVGAAMVRLFLAKGLNHLTDSITVNVNMPKIHGVNVQVQIIVDEFTGIPSSGAMDVYDPNTGSGARVSSGPTATTHQAREVIYGGFGINNNQASFSSNTGYTTCGMVGQSKLSSASQYQMALSVGTFSNGGTFPSGSGAPVWSGLVAAFRATGVVTSDTGTAHLSLLPSALEVRAHQDAATVRVAFTPSATLVAPRVDAATARLSLMPSAQSPAVTVDTASVLVKLTPSAVSPAIFADAAGEYLRFAVAGSDTIVRGDSGTERLSLRPSSTQTFLATDATTERLSLSPQSIEIRAHDDSNTETFKFRPTAVEIAAYREAQTVQLALTVQTEQEIYQPHGFPYADTNDASIALTPKSTQVAGLVDSATSRLSFRPSLVAESYGRSDSGTGRVNIRPSGSDSWTSIDSARPLVVLTPASTDQFVILDSGVVSYRLRPSSSDLTGLVDAGVGYLHVEPEDGATSESIDADSYRLALSPASTNLLVTVDSALALLGLSPATVAEEYAQQVRLVFTADGVEIAVFEDDALVRLAFTVPEFGEIGTLFMPTGTMRIRWNATMQDARYTQAGDVRYNGQLDDARYVMGQSGPRWGGTLNG